MSLLHGSSLLTLLIIAGVSFGSLDLGYRTDKDLTSFVTRPEIRAPVFQVTHKASEGVTPGLWFFGPYAKVAQEPHPSLLYQACSTGPHIYDNDGNLVWSGACAMRNQNACDFRVFTDDEGTEFLSTILYGYQPGFQGAGAVLDSSYRFSEAVQNMTPRALDSGFNMHEFKVIDGGRSALYIMSRPERVELTELVDVKDKAGWVANIGFREVDLQSGRFIYEWWSSGQDRVSLAESTAPRDGIDGPHPVHWNFFHPNSVDKSPEGDYLLNGRFVDTIYKISGKDGSIMWRLGGRNSSFELSGFNFSKQHDAQFLGYDSNGAELISLFDNAQAHQNTWLSEATANTSSCLVVALDYRTMTASLVKQIWRPDGKITALRGNFQTLPNGNTVESWSENAYVSEHASDGRRLFEGRFTSERFVTYRAYKFNFTGHPIEPPTLKAIVYGLAPDSSTTVFYVSWNGATEVSHWRFSRDTTGDVSVIVGTTPKTGFETTFISDGCEGRVYVEALARNGSVIGTSPVQHAEWPVEWDLEDSLTASELDGHQHIIDGRTEL